jgi:hypothetical protein
MRALRFEKTGSLDDLSIRELPMAKRKPTWSTIEGVGFQRSELQVFIS